MLAPATRASRALLLDPPPTPARKPYPRGFSRGSNASDFARRAHELKRLGEAPDVYEWSREEARQASRKAARLRTERARWARDQRVFCVRLRWRLRALGLPDEEEHMSQPLKPSEIEHMPPRQRVQRLHEELAALDDDIAQHRRTIKQIQEARKEVEAEVHRLLRRGAA
jgi:hypothetical protein